jgi:hypothetical protein
MTHLVTIPIETKYLRLIEQDGTRYITMRMIAECMGCNPEAGMFQLQFMLDEAQSAFSHDGMRRLRHPEIDGKEELGLTLPSAIIMLARRRGRHILALHDMLVRLLGH